MQRDAHVLADLVDLGRVQRICNSLSAATGVALAVLDPDGAILIASGWQDICTGFHRLHEETVKGCLESDLRLSGRLADGREAPAHIAYKCANGLWDVAFPLIVDSEHLANVFVGQFFYDDDEIDLPAFRERARRLGFDEEAYLTALGRVPVVSHAHAARTIDYLTDFVAMLGELGLAKLHEEQAAAAARANSEALEEAQVMAGLGRWELDLAENRLDWSPGIFEIFEIDPEQFAASYEGFVALIHPDDRAAVDGMYAKSLKDHEAYDIVHRLLMKDGRVKWVHERCRTDYNAEGVPLRSVGVVQDITESRRAERALRQSQRLYETFINATDDMAFLKDEELRYVIVNEANAAFFGLGVAEVVGRIDADLMPPASAKNCLLSDEEALRRGSVVVSHEEVEGRVYETRKFPVRLGDDRRGVGGYVRDVTERKQIEEEILRLNNELEERVLARTTALEAANRELESFAYAVSHDLRAPLRALDGFSAMLLEDYGDRLDDKGRGYLDRIRAADQRMASLIDALLELSRLNRGELMRERLDLSTMTREVALELVEAEPGRAVELVVADGLEAEADRDLVQALLANLLDNAWKFTARHATARIEVGAVDAGGARAFFVRDDGAGFDMACAGKLYGAFQRLHGADEFEGLGIGLATVQRIVRRHGGRVWAEGAVEQGATFWFTLPAATPVETSARS